MRKFRPSILWLEKAWDHFAAAGGVVDHARLGYATSCLVAMYRSQAPAPLAGEILARRLLLESEVARKETIPPPLLAA